MSNNSLFSFSAEIKVQVFRDIFLSMTKNMRQNQNVFFSFSKTGLGIGLREQSGATQMQLTLKREVFSTFNFAHTQEKTVKKYNLSRFLHFNNMFQSSKGLIKITVNYGQIKFSHQISETKIIDFIVAGLNINQVEQEDIIKHGFKRDQALLEQQSDNFKQMKFQKAKNCQQVIHIGNTMKIATLQFSYYQDRLRIGLNKDQCHYTLKTKQVQEQGLQIHNVNFLFRKVKLAMGLLQAEKPFLLTLYPNAMTISFDEAQKKQYNITIFACGGDEKEQI